MLKALYRKKLIVMDNIEWEEYEIKVVASIRLYLADDVMYQVIDKKSLVETRESIYVQVIDEWALS